MTLKNKVMNYIINHHQQGVHISEMEMTLKENRMRLGYVAKSLIEEGKIEKVDNVYFPKNKIKEGGGELTLGP